MNRLNRRKFLRAAAVCGAGALLPRSTFSAEAAGNGVIDLRARPIPYPLVGEKGPASDLWSYGDGIPGPMLRARRGEKLTVNFRNDLSVPTSVHWHGIRIENAMDGVAGLTQDPVPPGETFTYRFTVPDAGTYWYHAHDKSWEQVARGLYGPLIVTEDEPAVAEADDFTLMLDDWRVDRSGRFDTASLGQMMDWSHGGRLGNLLTANGQTDLKLPVPRGKWFRLRLINAANARILVLDPAQFPGRIVALDGQPVSGAYGGFEGPLLLAPAQRVDFMVRLDTNETVVLKEVSGEPYPFATLQPTPDAATGIGDAPGLPDPDLPAPDMTAAFEYDLRLDGGAMSMMARPLVYQGKPLAGPQAMMSGQVWGLNGVANLMDKPMFSVKRGQTVIINTANPTNFSHAMHLHGHHFRVLDNNGVADPAKPWRDTFLIGVNGTTRIAFVADNPGKWLLHCHMLEHAAAGMTGWIEVV